MTDARQTAAKLAAQINEIVSARGSNYGAPEDNFANIANFWNAWLHARYKCLIALDPVDVGVMSSLIKVARLAQTPDHEDSALAGAIYMLLGYGCGVSDREPGMSDEGFPEPAKPNSVFVESGGRVIPFEVAQADNHWYCPPLAPDTSYKYFYATKWDGPLTLATYVPGDWVAWAKEIGIVKWRYPTQSELIDMSDPEEMKPGSVFVTGLSTTPLDKQGSAAQLKGLSLLPYDAKRDANNFSKVMYGTGFCPQEGYYIVFKLKHGIAISGPISTVGLDWVEWTKNAGAVGVDKWRYATDAEVIAFEEGNSNV